MAKFNDQQKEAMRFSRDQYSILFDHSDSIVFVYEPDYRIFYVFGSIACRLNQIIIRLGLEIFYPASSIDADLYYEIPDNKFYYLLYNLVHDEQPIQII